MKLTVYDNFERFRERALPFLERSPINNNLMIGIILNIERYREIAPFTAIVEDAGEVFLVILRTPPHRIMLAGEGRQTEAVRLLVDYCERHQYSLPGVIGPKPVAECLAKQWAERFGQLTDLYAHLRVLALHEVLWSGDTEGVMRQASESDLDLLEEWTEAYRTELRYKINLTDARTWAEDEVRHGQLFFWEVDGVPVTMGVKEPPSRGGVCVGSIYTTPQFRKQGYATALVAALSTAILSVGSRYCMLFADCTNTTAIGIYQKIGYRHIGDFQEIDFILTE